MNRGLELNILFNADLGILFHILEEFPKYGRDIPSEKQKEYVQLILELDKFVAIHRTRTQDLLTYANKIETARMEYGKMRDRNNDLEEQVKVLSELNSKIIDESLLNL